jgi:VWFA-related protein
VAAIPVAAIPGGGYPGGGYPGGRGGGYPGGNTPSQSHVDGKKILERITQETGGRLFEVKKSQTVAQIYNQIAEELRAQYRLGYTPSQDAAADGYHQIDLSLHQKGLFIQTRDGYYTGK